MTKRDPINPTDDDARALARQILTDTRYGALAVLHSDTGLPYVARVAMLWIGGGMHTLVSSLSTHTAALAAHPDCAALIGEPGDKGDPLTHPRMTVRGRAELVDKAPLRDSWLDLLPKAQLYYDFTDFRMYRLRVSAVDLNGGFGKAYRLGVDDLPSE